MLWYVGAFSLVLLVASGGALGSVTNQNDVHSDIHKRAIRKQSMLWKRGIVPYVIETKDEALKASIMSAMAFYEYNTCVRFVPWNKTINQDLKLGRASFLKLNRGPSCIGGDYKSKDGQGCNCYTSSCRHELGHALGLVHEQGNDLHKGWIRINWDTMKWGRYTGSYHLENSDGINAYGYDIQSYMHYGHFKSYTDKKWKKSNIGALFPELIDKESEYYSLRDIALGYQCHQYAQCDKFTLTCVNDGYVTVLAGRCACRCPRGLDPATGCRTTIQSARTDLGMPRGQYGLPMVKGGCSDSSFQEGTRTHFGEYKMTESETFSLESSFFRNKALEKFCVRTADDVTGSVYDWPLGNYCFYRKNGTCPEQRGMKDGAYLNILDKWTFDRKLQGSSSGVLPDGKFDLTETSFKFCCSKMDTYNLAMTFPNGKPLVLFKNGKECPDIEGMDVRTEFFGYSNNYDPIRSADPLTSFDTKNQILRIFLCVYTPIDMDCGGVVQLNETNKVATIEIDTTNPRSKQCTWLLKGSDEKGTVVLEFQEFDVDCKDRLEVRFTRPGHIGNMYCGDNQPTHPFYSIYDKMVVQLRTTSTTKSRFKATVRWAPDSDLCYNAADKGTSYDGKVNFTRWFEPCLPWTEVTHCNFHAFQEGLSHTGLEENYCRNPDDTFMPWCYVNGKNCWRNYCDVCNSALDPKFTSHLNACPKEHPNCRQDTKKASSIHCGPPDLTDGILQGTIKPSYNIGDRVKFQCSRDKSRVVRRTCLTSGQWSSPDTACPVCPDGFELFQENCYRFFLEFATQAEATARCQKYRSTLAMPKSRNETVYIDTLRFSYQVWIGLSKPNHKSKFVWADGSDLDWTNWMKYRPDKRDRKFYCVVLHRNVRVSGYIPWMDVVCGDKHPFVCEAPKLANSIECMDSLPWCSKLHRAVPDMCTKHKNFGEQYCTSTCGACGGG